MGGEKEMCRMRVLKRRDEGSKEKKEKKT